MRPNHRLRRILFQRPLARRAGRAIGLTVLADNSAPAGAKGPEGGSIGVYGGVRGGGRAARALRAAAVGHLICARTVRGGLFQRPLARGAGRAIGIAVLADNSAPAGAKGPAGGGSIGMYGGVRGGGRAARALRAAAVGRPAAFALAVPIPFVSPDCQTIVPLPAIFLPGAGCPPRHPARRPPPGFVRPPREGRILAGIQRPPVRVHRAA